MRAATWKTVLGINEHSDKASLSRWLEDRKYAVGLDRNHTWYYDQWITTHGLLKNRLCNAPPYSGLWAAKGLEFDPDFEDSKVCFHGFGYKDCNRNIHIVYEGCKWWHFYPDQTFQEHIQKFHEITKNQYELQITNPYQ